MHTFLRDGYFSVTFSTVLYESVQCKLTSGFREVCKCLTESFYPCFVLIRIRHLTHFLRSIQDWFDILKDTIEPTQNVDTTRYREQYKAVFVSDGIRYILSGRVSLDTMKDILNSLSS